MALHGMAWDGMGWDRIEQDNKQDLLCVLVYPIHLVGPNLSNFYSIPTP